MSIQLNHAILYENSLYFLFTSQALHFRRLVGHRRQLDSIQIVPSS